jgi:hypothetical protein
VSEGKVSRPTNILFEIYPSNGDLHPILVQEIEHDC